MPAKSVVAAGMEGICYFTTSDFRRKVSIGIENPVYKNAYEILKELDFKIHPISMDESGMCVEQLQKTDANLAYVTPAHQYPTGVIMPIGRRSQLLGWAKKIQIIILSKMIMTASSDIMENQFQRCRGLDDGENVIYMGTFSKAIRTSDPSKLYGAPKETCKEISADWPDIFLCSIKDRSESFDAVSDRRAF